MRSRIKERRLFSVSIIVSSGLAKVIDAISRLKYAQMTETQVVPALDRHDNAIRDPHGNPVFIEVETWLP